MLIQVLKMLKSLVFKIRITISILLTVIYYYLGGKVFIEGDLLLDNNGTKRKRNKYSNRKAPQKRLKIIAQILPNLQSLENRYNLSKLKVFVINQTSLIIERIVDGNIVNFKSSDFNELILISEMTDKKYVKLNKFGFLLVFADYEEVQNTLIDFMKLCKSKNKFSDLQSLVSQYGKFDYFFLKCLNSTPKKISTSKSEKSSEIFVPNNNPNYYNNQNSEKKFLSQKRNFNKIDYSKNNSKIFSNLCSYKNFNKSCKPAECKFSSNISSSILTNQLNSESLTQINSNTLSLKEQVLDNSNKNSKIQEENENLNFEDQQNFKDFDLKYNKFKLLPVMFEIPFEFLINLNLHKIIEINFQAYKRANLLYQQFLNLNKKRPVHYSSKINKNNQNDYKTENLSLLKKIFQESKCYFKKQTFEFNSNKHNKKNGLVFDKKINLPIGIPFENPIIKNSDTSKAPHSLFFHSLFHGKTLSYLSYFFKLFTERPCKLS